MSLGKFGLNLSAIAVLAFVLCFFGFTEVLVLVVAFAAILEKDAWLTRQTFQALYLRIAYAIAITVLGWFFTLVNSFFSLIKAYSVVTVMNGIHDFLDLALYIGLFVIALLAVLKLAKNKDAGVPGLGKLADVTMGIFTPKAAPVAPVYQPAAAPVAPVYQQPAAPVAAPAAPVAAPAAPAAPATPAAPAAPTGTWTCPCGRDNTGNFCMSCGKPRP